MAQLFASQSRKEQYHIISLIGKGAYGQVYKARVKKTGQFVAIKSVKKKSTHDKKDVQNMRGQIEILKTLKHPNIVVLLDAFETKHEFMIITQLCQGQLFNIIEDDQFLQQAEIRKVAQQIIRALYYLHSNRVLHRDLKPQNILITSQGTLKICDFGFARALSPKTQMLKSIKGTPLYMAPQVVQQKFYNNSADLWSLGIILYQLATGSPPFTAANILNLVEHIKNDPVRIPDTIRGDFRNLLKGLLIKDPNLRLGWPDLLNHPFIRETQQQKISRKQKIQKFSAWVEQNHHNLQDYNQGTSKSLNKSNFDINRNNNRNRSPLKSNNNTASINNNNNKIQCQDQTWNNYLKLSYEQKTATQLRIDQQFYKKLQKILSAQPNQILRIKQQKDILYCAIKTLTTLTMKSNMPQNKNIDICRKLNIPNYLLQFMKYMIKIQNGKNYMQLISQIVKVIGLLAKSSYNKKIGIQMVYIRSFLPLLPNLLSMSCSSACTQPSYQTLTTNLLRTVGIFTNNASCHYLRSFSYYKDIIQLKFVPQFITIYKFHPKNITVHRILIQLISALLHPVLGDIQYFPWRRQNYQGIKQYKQFITMLECIRQSIVNRLLQIDWLQLLEQIIQLQQQQTIIHKISVLRIILQSIRQSKQFTDNLINKSSNLLQYIFNAIDNKNKHQHIYGVGCLIISQIIKHRKQTRQSKKQVVRENMKQNVRQNRQNVIKQDGYIQKQYINQVLISNIISRLQTQIDVGISKDNSLVIFGIFFIMQQLLNKQNINLQKLCQYLIKQRTIILIHNYLSTYNMDTTKIELLRYLQGSNYGLHIIGYYDPIYLCMHRFILRLQKDNNKDMYVEYMKNIFSTNICGYNICYKIADMMIKISCKTDLSPKGMIAYVSLVYDIIAYRLPAQFNNINFIKNLINLLNESQIQTILQWPINYGGGQTCSQLMLGTIMNIFLLYLQYAQKQPEILKIIYQSELLHCIIIFTKYLNKQTITTVLTFISNLITFTSQKTPFIKQFIQFGGIGLYSIFNLLKIEQYSTQSIIQACNLLAQIARSSKDTYEYIDSNQLFVSIKKLLRSNQLQLKSNLLRNSSYFFDKVQKYQIINDVILLCDSNDRQTRKNACVILGNAAFHQARLYKILRMSMPKLVSLLKDNDQKVRSNSAAALGNMARNSDELDQDFISTGANYQLVNLLINQKSIAAKRVTILAIINLLGLKQSGKLLRSANLNLNIILSKCVSPAVDQNLAKTAQKAIDKLQSG